MVLGSHRRRSAGVVNLRLRRWLLTAGVCDGGVVVSVAEVLVRRLIGVVKVLLLRRRRRLIGVVKALLLRRRRRLSGLDVINRLVIGGRRRKRKLLLVLVLKNVDGVVEIADVGFHVRRCDLTHRIVELWLCSTETTVTAD